MPVWSLTRLLSSSLSFLLWNCHFRVEKLNSAALSDLCVLVKVLSKYSLVFFWVFKSLFKCLNPGPWYSPCIISLHEMCNNSQVDIYMYIYVRKYIIYKVYNNQKHITLHPIVSSVFFILMSLLNFKLSVCLLTGNVNCFNSGTAQQIEVVQPSVMTIKNHFYFLILSNEF